MAYFSIGHLLILKYDLKFKAPDKYVRDDIL